MINDDDLRAMRDSALAAWGLTIAIITVVFVVVKSVIY
jgi:t-SNARE complex subunit (syntaxin)